jgi:hypothetical protein
MWDIPGGGLPLEPIRAAMRSLGEDEANPPGFQASREDRMRAVWEQNELRDVETRVIRIRANYPNFDDFWESNSVPVGPSGAAIAKLSPEQKEKLKNLLRQRLSTTPGGAISYEPFAKCGERPGLQIESTHDLSLKQWNSAAWLRRFGRDDVAGPALPHLLGIAARDIRPPQKAFSIRSSGVRHGAPDDVPRT